MKRALKIIKSAFIFTEPSFKITNLIFGPIYILLIIAIMRSIFSVHDSVGFNMMKQLIILIYFLPFIYVNGLLDNTNRLDINIKNNQNFSYFYFTLPISKIEFVFSQFIFSCVKSLVFALPALISFLIIYIKQMNQYANWSIGFGIILISYYYLTCNIDNLLRIINFKIASIFYLIAYIPFSFLFPASMLVLSPISKLPTYVKNLSVFSGITGFCIMISVVIIGSIIGYIIPLKLMQKRWWSK